MPADPPFPAISAAVSGLVAASQTGFTISENGAQPLLVAIRDLQSEIADALRDSSRLEAEPPLGATPNANIYKPFIATVASDPVQGAVPALRMLHDQLDDAHAAIQQSMTRYVDTDDRATTDLNRSGTWI